MARNTPKLGSNMVVGDVDASAAPLYYWTAPQRGVIRGLSLVNTDAVAAHATDIMTVIVINRGQAGAGTTEVGRQTVDSDVTGFAAVVAKTKWPLILSTTAANLEVEEGDVLEFAITEGGTATSGDMSAVSLAVEFQPGAGVGGT